MNLIFDIGNSGAKVAVVEGDSIITSFRSKDLDCNELQKKLFPYKIDKAVISSVKKTPEFIIDLLTIKIAVVHIVSHKSKLPFTVEYETPETLGSDRIAAVTGAFNLFPGSNALVIDAGTAITYDLLAGNTYKGGNISPGLSIRFKALNKYTGSLPLVTDYNEYQSPAKNTTDAIRAGVVTGLISEINEYIRIFGNMYPGLKCVLTGGDSSFLVGKLSHQVILEPDIVIKGLNFILEYNTK